MSVMRRARVEVGKEVEDSFSPSKSWRVGLSWRAHSSKREFLL